MSRGFVKEGDYTEPVPVRPARVALTARGMASLERQLAESSDPARRAELERRIAAAFVPAPPSDPRIVAFGATVLLRGAASTERSFSIVGDDEIDVARGLIGASSPLAQALLGARAGDVVVWPRPAGDRSVSVCSVEY